VFDWLLLSPTENLQLGEIGSLFSKKSGSIKG